MRFITYKEQEYQEEKTGVVVGSQNMVYDLKDLGYTYSSMSELVSNMGEKDLQTLSQQIAELTEKGAITGVPYAEVQKCAPIPVPEQDILCLGINYMAHAEESARYKKEAFNGERPYPVYFSKRVNRAVADGEEIQRHGDIVERLDYESELAVIIGKDAKNVSKEDAYDYVFGYTIINDVSARAIQTRHKQWYFGKSLDGFTPMGPWIVTKDEIPGRPELKICSRVNGELRQNSNTDLLIFDIAYVIHELSQGMTLKAGTIISMGTPAGVGMGFDPPKFLKSGDVVECEIEKIGTLTNVVSQ
ncbi:MAG: fumarylacetoacetate hydrolase family protein [Lachnospiraceae bacterium]|nr:fumarylacetoacetate hydrolase family protein [Lachnospiraceae bacterium]